MSPSMSATDIAIRIPHILQTIGLACDTSTFTALMCTARWVHDVVNICPDNLENRLIHIDVRNGHMTRAYPRKVIEGMAHVLHLAHLLEQLSYQTEFPTQSQLPAQLRWCDTFPGARCDEELLHTTVDLHGETTALFEAEAEMTFPATVRLRAYARDILCVLHNLGYCGCSKTEITYPRRMPRARCVVAFPFPWDTQTLRPVDAWNGHVEVLGTQKWVFDRAVYHVSAGRYASSSWGREWDRPSILHLATAWHTVLLVRHYHDDELYSTILGRIVHLATITLQRRIHVPDAHVTVVVDIRARTPAFKPSLTVFMNTRPNTASFKASIEEFMRNRTRIRTTPPKPNFEDAIRDAVKMKLTNYHSDEFVADAIAAIKHISWADYRKSVTPRQYELETIA